jgi:hypothetical protein
VLSPIIAEFLLGDFSIRDLPLVLALLPLYGCGALLTRELARRTGRGWPTIVLLATAYALLEEGFLTQSLVNPPPAIGPHEPDWARIPREPGRRLLVEGIERDDGTPRPLARSASREDA